ncbi:MAG: aminodeoxychorismate lyase [Nitrosomonadales bacterium]|nr:MAG: aminodeoxychorismate lyase [Nitrosomonadales bacterium]
MSRDFLINGRRDGCISPFDRGFAYGDGVFRTLPVRDGTPHCWERHYRKLCEDCKVLGIVCPPEEVLAADIAMLVNAGEDATVKIVITRGESIRGYAVPALAQPMRTVIRTPDQTYAPDNASEGVKLHLCALRLSHQPKLAGVKHLNRLENVLARMEWVDAQFADGLLLDVDDHVIECTMSNIFIRTGTQLTTPDISRCGVAGVTRERILELAPLLACQAVIADFKLEQLFAADEVIICNSLYGAWQVRELKGKVWPRGGLATELREHLLLNDTRTA